MKNILLKIKDAIYSENGMKVVNVLFFLFGLSRSWFGFIAYAAWIIYLVFCIKHTDSKTIKTVLAVFVGIAAVLTCLSLYSLLQGLPAFLGKNK